MKAVNYRAIPLSLDLEADSPPAVGEVVGDNPEAAYLGGVGYVGPDAGACVVVPDPDYPEGLRDILRQLAQVDYRACLRQRYELNGDRQGSRYHLIDLVLNGLDLLLSGALRQQIVAFALLPLDMGVARAGTAEHPHHRLVEDMFGRVHRSN